jgi:hypothetical protein
LFQWSEIVNNNTADSPKMFDVLDGNGAVWYALSYTEWTYLLNTRSASTINGVANARYAKATVAGVAGLIIFPDEYTHPSGLTAIQSANTGAAAFTANTFDATAWSAMADAGAVFLPAAGIYDVADSALVGVALVGVGSLGSYWSSTPDGYDAHSLGFYSNRVRPNDYDDMDNYISVRPVRDYTP